MTGSAFTENSGNNQNDQFDDVLERCLKAIENGQVTIEQCIARFPQYAELGELLSLAVATRELPRPMMSAAFTTKTQQRLQAQLRRRVQAVQRATRTARPGGFWLPVRRALTIVFILLIVVIGSGFGLVRASANTAPGDGLYGIKRLAEQGQLFLAFGNRPSVLFDIAEARISEIGILAGRGQVIAEAFLNEMSLAVSGALGSMTDQTARARLVTDASNAVQGLRRRALSASRLPSERWRS
jgi:hypothetical protein